MHLPIVDFRGADAAQAFCRNLRDTGFGVLSNHPLDQNLVQGIYFAKPLPTPKPAVKLRFPTCFIPWPTAFAAVA